MKKIESLTKDQEAKILQVRDEWINFAASGKIIERAKCEKLVEWLYKESKLEKPIVVFVDSPLGAQMAVAYVKELLKFRKGFSSAQVRAQVGDQVRDQVGAQVGDQVRAQVGAQVWAQVWAQVGDQVGAQVWAQVWAQVGDQVWAQVRASKLEWSDFSSYGNYSDFGWLAFYSYFDEVFGLVKHKNFVKFRELIKTGVYDMIQLQNLCVVVQQPEYIKRNERMRLHSEATSSVRFRDGYELHFLNGIAFKKELWEKIATKTITSKEALEIESTDQRAIALQFIGGEKLMKDFDGKVIATDEYGELIELPKLLDTNGVPYKYLRAFNPESQDFVYLRTWPEVKTPAEAEARSYRLERLGVAYKPDSRT